ncbi:MAG: flagellar hook-length control protein FliK [Bacillota bacterium]
MLFVNSGTASRTLAQGSQSKNRSVETDCAFEALMSLALSAFFGGGAQVQMDTQATQAPQGSLNAAGPVEASAQMPGEFSLWEDAAAEQQAETGGNVKTQVSDTVRFVTGYVPAEPVMVTRAGEQLPAAPAAEMAGPAVDAFGASGSNEAEMAAAATLETLPIAVVAIRTTTEAAVAPAYKAPVAPKTAPVVLPANKKAGDAAVTTSYTVDAPLAEAGSHLPVRSAAESVLPATEPAVEFAETARAATAGSPVAAARREDRNGAGEDRPSSKDSATEAVAAGRTTKPSRTGFLVDTDTPGARTSDAGFAAVERTGEAASVDHESDDNCSQERLSVLDARAISETLLQESQKKLPRSVEIRLDPPELGNVTVLLSQRGQDVTVKFVAGNVEAQRMLQSATDDLGRALSDKGLSLAGFSVDPGNPGNDGQNRRGDADKPATRRYHSATRLGAVGSVGQYGQPAGSFNWLA